MTKASLETEAEFTETSNLFKFTQNYQENHFQDSGYNEKRFMSLYMIKGKNKSRHVHAHTHTLPRISSTDEIDNK